MALRDVGGPGEIKKHLEVETYMYAGVAIRVRIDYDAGTISLFDLAAMKYAISNVNDHEALRR